MIDSAQVARMTFYKHFGGKEGLILAYLDGRDVRWRGTLERAIEAARDTPHARSSRRRTASVAFGSPDHL